MNTTLPPQTSLSRDFLILAMVIFTTLILVSIWVADATYEDHSDKIILRLQNEATRIDRDLSNDISHISFLVESLARQINHTGTQDTSAIATLLQSFNNEQRKNDIFAWVDDTQHITITSQRGILRKPIDIADRDYVKKALTTPWKVHIGRPVLGRLNDKWVLPISIGIADYNGNHLGMVLAGIDVDTLTKNIQREMSSDGIHFAIVSKTLAPLTESIEDNDKTTKTFNPTDLLEKIDVAEYPSRILSRASLYKQHVDYLLYTTSELYPYIIIISYGKDMSNRQISTLLAPRILQIIVIAIFLIMLLWLIQMRVIHPVATLSEHAEEVIQGKAFRSIPSGAPKEIDVLADKINSLSDYIHERLKVEDELITKNNYLRKIKDSVHLLNTARMRFLDSLAKELQKPVATIYEAADTLRSLPLGTQITDQHHKHTMEIHRNSELLKQMIADIITVAKFEEDHFGLNERMMDLGFCIHHALRTFHEQPQNRHIDVKMRLDDNMPRLAMDEERFHQILINLFNHAASQMIPSSTMVFEVEVDKRDELEHTLILVLKYNLAIEDDKVIVQRERHHIAQMPSLASSKQSYQSVQSDGINMALTRMLVSLHQGEMETRVSPNQVVRHYLRFPIQKARLLQDNVEDI